MPEPRNLTYFIATTIDGFITGPDGGDPSGPNGFWPLTEDYVEFLAKEFPETLPVMAREALGITAPGLHFDTVVEGRRSYQIGLDAGVDDAYPHLRHLVFSSTLDPIPGSTVELVRQNPIERVRELKAEQGNGIWIVGGGSLASTLAPEIDRLIIKLSPITVGSGIPLWGVNSAFDLTSWERTTVNALPGGTTIIHFERTRE